VSFPQVLSAVSFGGKFSLFAIGNLPEIRDVGWILARLAGLYHKTSIIRNVIGQPGVQETVFQFSD
jgi:hypothetical protein